MKPATAKTTSRQAPVQVHKDKADAFAQRMLQVLNDAAIAMMTSIGHRTGLFEVMSKLEPSSAPAIAEQAGLDKRYVKEWLGAMVTGGIVDYDAENQRYVLPPEHAVFQALRIRNQTNAIIRCYPHSDGDLTRHRECRGLPNVVSYAILARCGAWDRNLRGDSFRNKDRRLIRLKIQASFSCVAKMKGVL